MKKALLFITLVLMVTTTANAQIRLGLSVGFLVANASTKEPAIDYGGEGPVNDKVLSTFKFGILSEIPLAKSIVFMPEVNYVNKGVRQTYSNTIDFRQGETQTINGDITIKMNYLEMPFNIAYKATTSSGIFFAGAGPVLSLGLSGKVKSNYKTTYTGGFSNSNSDTSFQSNIKFDGKKNEDITDPNDYDAHFKRLEIGVNLFAGYVMGKGFFVKAMYNLAFSNINPQTDFSYKSSYFGIGVGFLFGDVDIPFIKPK